LSTNTGVNYANGIDPENTNAMGKVLRECRMIT